MKGKRTFIFIGILGILAVVIFTNFSKIKFTLNMYSIYKNSKNQRAETEKYSSPLENPLEEFVDKSDKESGKNQEAIATETTEIESSKKGYKEQSNSENKSEAENKAKDVSKKSSASKSSYENIVGKYNSQLNSVQSEFEGKLSQLAASSYQEYQSGKMSGRNLANKYISIGSSLEGQCDSRVYSILNNMEQELKSNGYSTAIVGDAKNYYESFKRREKERLMNQALANI